LSCTPANRSLFIGYAGDPVNGSVDYLWILTASGRFSGFGAVAKNLVPGDTGQNVGAFIYDDCIGAPASCIPHADPVSLTYNGGTADNGSGAAVSSDNGS